MKQNSARSERMKRQTMAFVILAVVTIFLVILNICIGSLEIPLGKIPEILSHPELADQDVLTGAVWKIRLPRMLAVFFLGGALALSGFLLQTFFNNPIAGPFILGISSGAKMVVAVVMILLAGSGLMMTSLTMVVCAFAGAMLATGVVLLISTKVDSSAVLIISGVMVGYLCTAVTDFMVTFADDASIVSLHNWSKGSFSGITWEQVKVMTVIVVLVAVLTFLLSKPISAYQLGEAYAQNMGVPIRMFRVALVLLSSILSAVVTAFAGPVSFVGVAVPHIVRVAFRTSKPLIMIPGCFLCGAAFCLLCDLIARTAFAPVELTISSVTAVFGAPIVIAVLIRKKRG